MPGFSRFTLVVLAFLSTFAFAQRIQFEGRGTKAQLKSSAVLGYRSVPSVDIQLELPGIDVMESEDGFKEIRLSGLLPIDQGGKPELYTTGVMIAVPEGFEPQIEVLEQESHIVEDVAVRPTQRKFRCAAGYLGFEFDRSTYGADTQFPKAPFQLEEAGKFQEVRLVRVALNPVQANGAKQQLEVHSRLHLRVNLKATGRATPTRLTKSAYQMIRQIAANGQYLGDSVQMVNSPEVMLVLVADDLVNAIAPLVAWNRQKGLEVEVITFSQAGGTKEKVQEVIQNYHDTKAKPSYLLFVGNKTTMPAFSESTGSGNAISDYRMALLSGNDEMPDALYGRILADNEDEVETQVNRIINYEKNPPAGNWFPNGAVIASQEGSNPSDQDYAEMVSESLKAGTYRAMDHFFQAEDNATIDNISSAINTGRTWLAYWGHGSGTAWGNTNGGYFSNSDVDQLNNQDRQPVLIDVACLNAAWGTLARPFGKAWVTQKNGGAVAFYGGSVSISWHPPALMSVGIAKYHFEKPVHSIGGSVMAGQMYLVEKMGTGNNVMDNIKWYNLFGDPSMLIRTDSPSTYQIKHRVSRTSMGLAVEVFAQASMGNGVNDLRVALNSSNGGTLAVGRTDASGRVILQVPGVSQLEPNTQLTSTGYNAETQQVILH